MNMLFIVGFFMIIWGVIEHTTNIILIFIGIALIINSLLI